MLHEAPCHLRLAKVGCGVNQSSGCHSDMLRHGRGTGHKSHDCYAVSGCPACHTLFTREHLGREVYEHVWQNALEETVLWLWLNGKIKVA